MTGDWACEAYGPEGLEVGARCFIAGETGGRVCRDARMCGAVMTIERRLLLTRLWELAATGDPVWSGMCETFTHPDQLLGGPRSGEVAGETFL